MSEVLATLTPTLPRRILGAGVLGLLGVLLVAIAVLKAPQMILWQVFLLALGAGTLVLAVRLWQVTAVRLELTAEVLRDSEGRVLAPVASIRSVSRGAFAFKPSNGFTLYLEDPMGRAWVPGLWWRLGRRVGIGGVTSGPEGRFMAETISGLLR